MRNLKFKKRLCCSVAAFLSLFVVCSINMHATNESNFAQGTEEAKVGEKAPDFTFTQDGKSMKLSDFAYNNIVLHFSGSSAESSRINADIAKLKVKYEHSDIAFINISIAENAEIAKLYGVSSDPTVCIIEPEGAIHSIDKENVDLSKKLFDIFGR